MEYTKGEWVIVGGCTSYIIRLDGIYGKEITAISFTSDNSKANAQLIASAPALYGALKLASELLSIGIDAKPQPIPLMIEQALAKVDNPSAL